MIETIPKIKHVGKGPLIIAGPCIIEDEKTTFNIAYRLTELCDEFQFPFIFKASYAKMNRTKEESFIGINAFEALNILQSVGSRLNIPTITDIHDRFINLIIPYVDCLQIPALLCKQTDILHVAGETGKWINIKKGQFASAYDLICARQKITTTMNNNIIVTERGNCFGYGNLVIDFRNISYLNQTFGQVLLDITHPLNGEYSSIVSIARAGIAAGADGLYFETHPDPAESKSDGSKMLKSSEVKSLFKQIKSIWEIRTSGDW